MRHCARILATRGPTLLGWAATPTFVGMAMAGILFKDSGMDLLCSTRPGINHAGSMPVMYLMMALFHAQPWIRLVSARFHKGTMPFGASCKPQAAGSRNVRCVRHSDER